MYPGGYEIGELEKKAVIEVIDDKYLFRYYGPANVESRVRKFEEEFISKIGVDLWTRHKFMYLSAYCIADCSWSGTR